MVPRVSRSTGFPAADSRDDFARARRGQTWSRIAGRLRGRSRDLDLMLPFDEVVAALGRRGEQRRGLRTVPVDAIVGSVDRAHVFDRRFRPTSQLTRTRFERIAEAARRGQDLPPVVLFQVGAAYFVQDGHHRVAVARALGREDIAAWVTEILTVVGADRDLTLADLPTKGHERLFRERVPLPPDLLAAVHVDDPDDYAHLAEGFEAWAWRIAQQDAAHDGERILPDRGAMALRWWHELYQPTLALLRDAGLITGEHADTAAYLRLSAERYRLLRTQQWDDDVVRRLRRALHR